MYRLERSYLPILMGATQLLGIIPTMLLINTGEISATPSILFFAFSTGILANIAGINVRPALINVNLPEARPAALSVANLTVNMARGLSPLCVTMFEVGFGGTRLAGERANERKWLQPPTSTTKPTHSNLLRTFFARRSVQFSYPELLARYRCYAIHAGEEFCRR